MIVEKPFVSIVIPTFNAAKYLEKCLESIVKQDYPKDRYEILVIDGGSTDSTPDIAQKFGGKILQNPYRDAESGKSIGIKNAQGETIALIDADNELVQDNWLSEMIKPLLEDGEIFGVESPWLLDPHDPLINQYATLLKIADPLARRFHPEMQEENRRSYVVYTAKVRQTPVIGANGFLWRKSMIKEINKFGEKFEEANYASYMVQGGYQKFARVKNVGIYHYYVKSWFDYAKKRLKIGRKFMVRKAKGQKTWMDQAAPMKFLGAVLYNLSVLGPFWEAVQNYKKDRKRAWFLHPLASFLTILIYCYATLEFFVDGKTINNGA